MIYTYQGLGDWLEVIVADLTTAVESCFVLPVTCVALLIEVSVTSPDFGNASPKILFEVKKRLDGTLLVR